MRKDYIISISLGQAHERTALALLEVEPSDDVSEIVCSVRHLTRYAPGSGFPDIIADTIKVAEEAKEQLSLTDGAALILEATSVGKPVVDLFKREESTGSLQVSDFEAMLVSAGDTESREYEQGVVYWRVPKRNLASVVQVLLQTSRLKIAPALPEKPALVSELSNFKVKINLAAPVDVLDPWREGAQDDLVFCVAAGCWRALKPRPQIQMPACSVSYYDFG